MENKLKINKRSIKDLIKKIYHINGNWESILKKINRALPQWITLLGGSNTINKRWLKNVLYKKTLLWATKKHSRVSKEFIFSSYLKHFKLSFSNFYFPIIITRPYLNFSDIKSKKGKEHVYQNLRSLHQKGGVYYFYMSEEPLRGYLGSSSNLSQRIRTHINASFNDAKGHPRFYNALRKYPSFSLIIVESYFETTSDFLREREQFYLDKISGNVVLKELSLNLDFNGKRNSIDRSVSLSTREKQSKAKKGKKLSNKTKYNIAHMDRLSGEKHHQWNKSLSESTKKLMSEKLNELGLSRISRGSEIKSRVCIYDTDDNLIKTFKTRTEGYKFFNLTDKIMLRFIKSDMLFTDSKGLLGLKEKKYKIIKI